MPRSLSTPIVLASPHSGRIYPQHFLDKTTLSHRQLRGMEDAYMDRLISPAVRLGIPVLLARFARAYVDLNRSSQDIDHRLFDSDAKDSPSHHPSHHVAAGLGVIPRLAMPHLPIYASPLSQAETRQRLRQCYYPYHAALQSMLRTIRQRFGFCVLIDMHSMPSHSSFHPMIIGDRFGQSCHPFLRQAVAQALHRRRFTVGYNRPFAGGFVTRHYGRPMHGVHVLQLEIDRSLYLDEAHLTLTEGFPVLQRSLLAAWQDLIASVMHFQPSMVAFSEGYFPLAAE